MLCLFVYSLLPPFALPCALRLTTAARGQASLAAYVATRPAEAAAVAMPRRLPACLAKYALGDVREVFVPQHAPLLQRQFAAWTRVGPLSSAVFNSSTPLVAALADAELRAMRRHMRAALREAAPCGVGAVLVDPARGVIVARARDRSRATARSERVSPRTPLQHAVMALLGVWGAECAAARDAGRVPHYLCRTFDVYTTLEPCCMCAMALLHSRVRRVVFGSRNAAFGGLGSRVRVHQQPNLNHRFSVYGGCLEAECERVRPPDGEGTCLGCTLGDWPAATAATAALDTRQQQE